MRKAGDLISLFFNDIDGKFMKKAKGYSSLSSSWAKITEANGIGMAAVHSRIRELDRNVLLIEADHSGWIQIFQTRQHRLLEDIRRRFPDLSINAISFRLSPGPLEEGPDPSALSGERSGGGNAATDPPPDGADTDTPADVETAPEKDLRGYDVIEDGDLKERLRHLERSIAAGQRKTDR
ncbi:MAG: DUF721 domain-containing protein [Treponema sp.]|jgi:hypothetical protein|nr:DUF721 domain-containing protein [Treponema sp.]